MHKTQRFFLSSLLAVVTAVAAGCGGQDPIVENGFVDPASTAAKTGAGKGGGTTTTSLQVSVSPNPVALNGYATVSVWPASTTQQLFVNWACTQNGSIVASGRSYELSYAAYNEPGYAWSVDHYTWTFQIPATSVFTAGPATCVAKVLTFNSKTGYVTAGQATFSVQ